MKSDPKSQLPPFHLHLTDVGGFLRAAAGTDPRLATLFPKGPAGTLTCLQQQQQQGMGLGPGQGQEVRGGGPAGTASGGVLVKRVTGGIAGGCVGRRPRLGEFLGQQKCQPFFKLQDSPVSKGWSACMSHPTVRVCGAVMGTGCDWYAFPFDCLTDLSCVCFSVRPLSCVPI